VKTVPVGRPTMARECPPGLCWCQEHGYMVKCPYGFKVFVGVETGELVRVFPHTEVQPMRLRLDTVRIRPSL
jgi:hypothetical protein